MEHKALKRLQEHLRGTGQSKLMSSSVGMLDLKQWTLLYTTAGQIDFGWPFTGSIDMSITFNERNGQWNTEGTMFGIAVEKPNPKDAIAQTIDKLFLQDAAYSSFMQNLGRGAELHANDINLLCYRLGVATTSTGHMRETGKDSWWWQHNDNKSVNVYLSLDPNPPTYGMPRKIKFGFYPLTSTHMWDLTSAEVSQMQTHIHEFCESAKTFCIGVSSCLTD